MIDLYFGSTYICTIFHSHSLFRKFTAENIQFIRHTFSEKDIRTKTSFENIHRKIENHVCVRAKKKNIGDMRIFTYTKKNIPFFVCNQLFCL